MKKKKLFFLPLLFCAFIIQADAAGSFQIDLDQLDKEQSIGNNINQSVDNSYKIDYQAQTNEEEQEIARLSRKVVYLLVGNENTEFTVENYMYRKEALQDMCYDPDIPKDENGDYDFTSQEAADSFIMSYFVGGLFKNIARNNPTYKKVGQPIVIKNDDRYLSSIAISDFTYNDYDHDNPMEIIRSTTDVIFYFEFKKDGEEWKLSYANAHFSDNTDQYFEDLTEQEASSSYNIEMNFDDLKDQFDFSKLEKVGEDTWEKLYNLNKRNSVILNSYYRNNVVNTANGFYLRKGVIVTTWSFVQKALQDSQYISITDSSGKAHVMEGIIYVNEDVNLVLLKQEDESGTTPTLTSPTKLQSEDPVFMISSKLGYTLKLSSGLYISTTNDKIKNVLPLTENDQGSPLYNIDGTIIGINTNEVVNNNFSNAMSMDLIQELQNQLKNQDFDEINAISFDNLKEQYFYTGENEETVKKNIKDRIWNKYKKIGNLEENIHMELVKASYKNKTLSLRYKNGISNFVSSMSLSKQYRSALIEDGYEEKFSSQDKYIYENKEYKIVLMDAFDYLIIIITEV